MQRSHKTTVELSKLIESQRLEYPDSIINNWWVCPEELRRFKDSGRAHVCHEEACNRGWSCRVMATFGLDGTGKSLPKSKRPYCGASTRIGGTCKARVVPGKRRCKMHGGLSTGPRTVEGRRRVSEAQQRRWANAHKDRQKSDNK